MPTYEYECELCHIRFEIRRSFGENGGTSCPQCHSRARHVFSPVPIIFKGSGFYVNDNKKKESLAKSDSEEISASQY